MRLSTLTTLLLCSAAAIAQDADGGRARIEAERRQVEARYAAEAADCRQRFFVTSCIDDAKARRREALDTLRQQELVLDDAERRRRAGERLQAIETRRAEAAARPPAASQPEPLIRVVPPATPASAPEAPRRSAPSASAAEAAAARASAAERRRQEAAARQARIAEREAERASAGQKSAPLPPRPEIAP